MNRLLPELVVREILLPREKLEFIGRDESQDASFSLTNRTIADDRVRCFAFRFKPDFLAVTASLHFHFRSSVNGVGPVRLDDLQNFSDANGSIVLRRESR